MDKIQGQVVPDAELRKELFSPESEGNQDTDDMTQNLGSIAADTLLVELRGERKATVDYLSSSDGKFSWKNTLGDIQEAGFQKIATNDPTESSFSGTIQQIRYVGRIGLTSAGGVDQVRRNGDLSRGFEKSQDNKKNKEKRREF